jgi:Inner membrane component of T3SS, cytoplasmic domain
MPEEPRNTGTIFRPDATASSLAFPAAFARAFPKLDSVYRGFRSDGVLMAAIVEGAVLDTYLHVPVSQRPEFAIIGRHDQCDLVLERDQSVSLRHLAVASARRGADEVRIRVLDLQTGSGLRTESGEPCEALDAEGPLFVSVGEYKLFCFPTGSLARGLWGDSAAEAWASFPERIYLDKRIRPRDRTERRPMATVARRSIITHIVESPQPLGRRRLPGDVGERIGALEIEAEGGRGVFPVHAREATRGILVGRYERCDLGVSDASLSRVHALLIDHDSELWIVDTASTNGIWDEQEERIRQKTLGAGAMLRLTTSIELRWSRRA